MTRITYFSFPAHGHMNPVLAIFRELVRRGCEIACYSTEPFRRAIEATGARFRSYGPRFQMPQRGPGPFARVSTTLETLLELTCAVMEHCLEQVRLAPRSQIMYDSFAPWGRMIADLLQTPAIASVPSILVNADIDRHCRSVCGIEAAEADAAELTPEWYADFISRTRCRLRPYGIEPPSPPELLQSYADCNLIYTSRLFQPLADRFDSHRFHFVGPCLEFRPYAPAFPFERLDSRPLVFVSLGTVYGDHPDFLRRCTGELASAPWQVVFAAGEHFPIDRLGPIPENFIVRAAVPQLEILPRAAVFLTHGGMNSVQEALYYGVPLILAPQGADQFWISARAVELGAGLLLDSRALTPGAIRSRVENILSNNSYAAAAKRIGTSLEEAGGAARAADVILPFRASREPGNHP